MRARVAPGGTIGLWGEVAVLRDDAATPLQLVAALQACMRAAARDDTIATQFNFSNSNISGIAFYQGRDFIVDDAPAQKVSVESFNAEDGTPIVRDDDPPLDYVDTIGGTGEEVHYRYIKTLCVYDDAAESGRFGAEGSSIGGKSRHGSDGAGREGLATAAAASSFDATDSTESTAAAAAAAVGRACTFVRVYVRRDWLRNVTEVNMSATSISGYGVTALAAATGRSLRFLRLANCPLLDDGALRAVVDMCESLQLLDVSRCPRLTTHGILYLSEASPPRVRQYQHLKVSNRVVTHRIVCSVCVWFWVCIIVHLCIWAYKPKACS